jgi:hypothetical protein
MKGLPMMRKFISSFFFVPLLAALLFAFSTSAMADDDPPGRVARLNFMQGSLSFQPSGENDWVQANPNRPLTTGDNLWADQNSRGELHIGSTAIRLSSQTGITFLNLDDRTVQIQLAQGSLSAHVRRLDGGDAFEIDTPNLAFTVQRPGEYRVDVDPNGNATFITVREGEGEITGGGSEFHLDSNESANFTGTDSLTYDGANPGPLDDFDQWCRSRDQREERAESARYVSRDVIGYEDLDEYGDWRSVPDYGYVWFPNRVAAGWAPYRFGHWTWIEPWGWTWVEDEPWGFAPFHYGRWAMFGGGWCWVPGPVVVRPVYAPALVVFVGGPRFGMSLSVGGGGGGVAWFPLGPREVFVPTYRTSVRYVQNVNVTNTTVNVVNVTNVYNNVNVTKVTYMHQNNVTAVTAVSHDTFVNARPVAAANIRVNQQQLQSAEVQRGAAIAPVRQSVVGAGAPASVRPPQAVMDRQVVVKQTPAPAAVSFQRKQQILVAQPGRVPTPQQMDQLRTQQMQQQPAMRSAPPAQVNNNNAQPARGAMQQQMDQSRGQQMQQQPAGKFTPPAQNNQNNAQPGRGAVQEQADQSRGQQTQQQPAGKFTPPAQTNQNNAQPGRGAVQQQAAPSRGQQTQQQPARSVVQQQAPPVRQQPPVKFAPPAAVNQDTYHPHTFEKPQAAVPPPAPPRPQTAEPKPPERAQQPQRGQEPAKPNGGEQDRKPNH